MAKPKLTKEAVRYVVKLYDSETENYTFSEIKDKLFEKFNIEVSLQAVQQNYHKFIEETNSEGVSNNSEVKTKEVRSKEVRSKTDAVRRMPKTSSSNIFSAFEGKKNIVDSSDKQYLDTNELNINSDEIKNLLKVDK